MVLQNRVLPDGTIVAQDWRGELMGNRGGKMHDAETKSLTTRRWVSKRWISCKIRFRQRQRQVMGRGYTELFFLDEVSALAAGHRPCFECRRNDATEFADCWEFVHGRVNGSRANAIDRKLHEERLADKATLDGAAVAGLPSGTMIACRGKWLAKTDGGFLVWSGFGYQKFSDSIGTSLLVTPSANVAVLAAGYKPRWHQSAPRVHNSQVEKTNGHP